ncbi:DUF1570 domain-containing protein [Planctopirus limnophila]|nr:DUF1570 domain-containing protein [Planctopirus limnophila]
MIRPHMLACSTCLVCWLAGLFPMVLRGDDWKSRHEAGDLSIFAEFPLRDVQGLVDELAALQGEIEATLRLKANDQPIEIYLFASRGSYVNHVSVRVPNAVNRRALYVQGKDAGRIYAYRHREMDIDVRHEATHAILHNCLPFVPLWLDEGLAEYFEVRQAERKSQNPHHSSTKWVRRFGGRPDLVALEKKRNLTDFDGGDYRDAWSVVHFMLHGPPAARKILDEYFETISEGGVPQSFSQAFPAQLGNWGSLYAQHFR